MNTDCMSVDEFVKTGHRTKTGENDLFWCERWEGTDHPPVLFLHGIPTWSWLWRNVLPVTGIFARSVSVDLPGFGLSSRHRRQDLSVASMANVIEDFIDETFGRDVRVVLVVHDFGALIGAELLCRNSERFPNLVIANTSLRRDAWIGTGLLSILSVPVLGQLSMWLARPWMLQLAMRPFVADPYGRTGTRFEGYWYPFERGFGQTLARLYQQPPPTNEDFERWRSALSGYNGRSLVLWGGLDPAFTIAEMNDLLELLPEPEAMVFDTASHFLPEDRPLSTGRRIRAFLGAVRV